VIGARPATGRSIFGLQAALSLSEHGCVPYISLEMSKFDLTKRAISNVGRIDGGHIQKHDLTERDWEQLHTIRPRLAKADVFIMDADVSITQLRRYIRSVHRRKPVSGIVLDYLHLLSSRPGDRRPKYEYISAMSRELKMLAMQLDVPVIVLAPLNRESERCEGECRRSATSAIQEVWSRTQTPSYC
jgi:replicative DNA helicase